MTPRIVTRLDGGNHVPLPREVVQAAGGRQLWGEWSRGGCDSVVVGVLKPDGFLGSGIIAPLPDLLAVQAL